MVFGWVRSGTGPALLAGAHSSARGGTVSEMPRSEARGLGDVCAMAKELWQMQGSVTSGAAWFVRGKQTVCSRCVV